MRALKTLALTIASAAALGGAALAEEQRVAAAPAFTIIEEDASIPFAGVRISGYEVADDSSLLIRTGPSQWYRATVWQTCRSDLRFENTIGFETRGTNTFDRFSSVIVDGRTCPIETIDRIERPARRADG